MNMILASASPRRKEILQMLGMRKLTVIPAQGEECAPQNAAPDEIVRALALAKAREVARQAGPEDVILAADTIVWFDGRVFGKPHSEEEAAQMLRKLSGNTHEVYTGVALIRGDRELCQAEESKVHFRTLTENEIAAYVASGEPMDKAGAYGAQGLAAVFVQGIEGDFFNVMGLPVCRLDSMLKSLGMGLL